MITLILSTPGLTYWHLNENELYHPLPDSFDSGAYLLLQEASMNLVSAAETTTSLSYYISVLFGCLVVSQLCLSQSLTQEPRLSLKEIYHNKQRTGLKRAECESFATVGSLSPQVCHMTPL